MIPNQSRMARWPRLLLALALSAALSAPARAADYSNGSDLFKAFQQSEAGKKYRSTNLTSIDAAGFASFDGWVNQTGDYVPVGWKACSHDPTWNPARQADKTKLETCNIAVVHGLKDSDYFDPHHGAWGGLWISPDGGVAAGYRAAPTDPLFRIYAKAGQPLWKLGTGKNMDGPLAHCIACRAQGGTFAAGGGAAGTCTPPAGGFLATGVPAFFFLSGPEAAGAGVETVVFANGIGKKILLVPYKHTAPDAAKLSSRSPTIASSTALPVPTANLCPW
jgi:hypothetical protein